jgi:hypothetical protein
MQKSETFVSFVRDLTRKMTASPELRHFGGVREVSNIMHALAKLKVPSKDIAGILNAVDSDSEWLMKSGQPQAVANTAWAFATLNVPAQSLFKKIDERASFLVENWNPQEIANTAWAFATLNIPARSLFKNIDERASFLVENGLPQNIANTAWAFATLGIPAPSLFKKINEHASFLVDNGNPQEIANTAWAFSVLSYDAPALFSAIDSRSEHILGTGLERAIANVALAFAELGMRPDSFFAGLEKRAGPFSLSAGTQSVCNVCWSLVILDLAHQHDALLQSLWTRAMSTDAVSFNSGELRQLVQIEVHAKARGTVLQSPVPSALRQRMVEAAGKITLQSSWFEGEFSELLNSMEFEHEREVSPFADGEKAGGVLAIDMACSARKIAIECDGPSHYLSSGRENGRTLDKRRLLERLGWKVVNIPYQDNVLMESRSFLEKNSARGGKRELKLLYLQNKLASVGVKL